MLKGNKGEWSEMYVFFKLLGDGNLYGADENLNKLEDIFYSIIKIIRSNKDNTEYHRNSKIEIYDAENNLLATKTIDEMLSIANEILTATNSATTTTYTIPTIEPILQQMHISKIKAENTDKRDITIKIHDAILGSEPTLGFSIKSQLGKPATLLNASKSTNVIYKLHKSLNDSEVDNLNTLDSLKKQLKLIYSKGNSLEYADFSSEVFKHNLSMIDYSLPILYAELVKYYFLEQDHTGNKLNKNIPDLVEAISKANPLSITIDPLNFYSYKFKELLTNIALGFVPATPWSGAYDATGGYILVKNDGEIICYHVYNRNEFRNYLFKYTKLDTPSRKRHSYGTFYNENGHTYVKLNAQIRYIR